MSKKKQTEKVFLPETPERKRLWYFDSNNEGMIIESETIKLNKDLTDDEHWKLSCAIWKAAKIEEEDLESYFGISIDIVLQENDIPEVQ